MFVVYDDEGAIEQTVKGPDPSYGELLDKQGYKWLFLEGAPQVDIQKVHVDVAVKAIVTNPPITLAADKALIAADGKDTATITGIPAGATVQVFCNDHLQATETVTDGQIEFTTTSPATYRFVVYRKCFIPAEITVVAA